MFRLARCDAASRPVQAQRLTRHKCSAVPVGGAALPITEQPFIPRPTTCSPCEGLPPSLSAACNLVRLNGSAPPLSRLHFIPGADPVTVRGEFDNLPPSLRSPFILTLTNVPQKEDSSVVWSSWRSCVLKQKKTSNAFFFSLVEARGRYRLLQQFRPA